MVDFRISKFRLSFQDMYGLIRLLNLKSLFRSGFNHQRRWWLRLACGFLCPLVMVGVNLFTGCGILPTGTGIQPLPIVAALPLPQLPSWIESISPTGETSTQAQIRIRFRSPLIPLESLDSPQRQDLLKKFTIFPPLPGQFQFLTPRMVAFQADQAIPKATRVRVTLKSGLTDLERHQLTQDLAWTFETEPLKISGLPGSSSQSDPSMEPEITPITLKPKLEFTSNVELDLGSAHGTIKLFPTGDSQAISVQISPLKQIEIGLDSQSTPAEEFDPSLRPWIYTLTPDRPLEQAKTYRVQFGSGLKPLRGNLPSTLALTSQVTTYGPLGFNGVKSTGKPDGDGSSGRFTNGTAQLEFNNGLMAESAIKSIRLTPQPKDITQQDWATVIRAEDQDSRVTINPWFLEPQTTYTLTIDRNLTDQYGQTLGKSTSVTFKTEDLVGDLWAPDGLHVLPADQNLQLNLSMVNLPDGEYQAAYQVMNPTDLIYGDPSYLDTTNPSILPNPKNWQRFKVPSRPNQTQEMGIPLRPQLGRKTGMLAYGVKARTYSYSEKGKTMWREPVTYGVAQLTNLGLFAEWFPDVAIIRVHRLSDGVAVPNARVEIYESRLGEKTQSPITPCATGRTDRTGTWQISGGALDQCYASMRQRAEKEEYASQSGPRLVVIAKQGEDWAFVRTEDYTGAYGYGIDAGWSGSHAESRGVIFSDRQLYQPGELAYFTGIAAYLKDGALQLDRNQSYTLTLEGPDGQTQIIGRSQTNEYGTFSTEIPLAANLPFGFYTLRARGSIGTDLIGEFRIAQFKPPNFKVDLDLGSSFVKSGQSVDVKASGHYLFGAPIQGGKIKYNVTRQKSDLVPKGWEQFTFGRQWFWPETQPRYTSDVLEQVGSLDGNGRSQQTVAVNDLPFPMTYRVDAEVTDVSNITVSKSQTFTALPADGLIGLQSPWLAEAGKPLSVQMIVTKATGNPIPGSRVRVELQSMTYGSITQVVEGSTTQTDQVDYKTVSQTEVSSGDRPISLSLVPPQPGTYRIRATIGGDERSGTELQIWVTGAGAVNWANRYTNNRLEVKLDKSNYQIGETATALIQSPYPEAELFFAILKDKPLFQSITKVRGSAPQVQFKVTPEMLPNAAVQVVLVRQGTPLSQLAELAKLDKLVKVGFAPFTTGVEDLYLQVKTTVLSSALAPNTEQSLRVRVGNSAGQPVPSQVTVMVVNEAVLQLTGYRPPDLVKTVYAEQPVTVRFVDNRPDVVLQPLSSPLKKGWGYGGGLSMGLGDTQVRRDFHPVAFFKGSTVTSQNGEAQFSFRLPDDLTTWRVMVVAADTQNFGKLRKDGSPLSPVDSNNPLARFGTGETTFQTTKPLIATPIMPQFVRPGDRWQGGVAITQGEKRNNALIQGTLGGTIQFDEKATPPVENIKSRSATAITLNPATIPAGTTAYRVPMVAGVPGKSEVRFTVELNGSRDGVAVPLEVRSFDALEQVIETGVTGNRVQIPFTIGDGVDPKVGGLEGQVSSTLLPQLTAPVEHVLRAEQLPFLEPLASQLLTAASMQLLSTRYGQKLGSLDPVQISKAIMAQLIALQKPDGGLAAYPGQTQSDPFVTPYAAMSLARAQGAGLSVAPWFRERVRSYLNKIIANPGQYDFCKDQSCRNQVRLAGLLAVAELGNPRNEFIPDLYSDRNNLDIVGKIQLARLLSFLPEWKAESQILTNQLQQLVGETGRSSQIKQPQRWSWLGTATIAQAQFLQLLIAQNASPVQIDRVVQGLLAQRRAGVWSGTYENANALSALVTYGQLQPTPPRFQSTVKLGGKTIANGRFQGYGLPSQSFKVPTAQLPKGKQTLTIQKTGNGQLHYWVAYGYRPRGLSAGRLNGLRVIREVRPANEEQVLYQFSLNPKEDEFQVSTGQVFDVGLKIITDHPVDQVVITDPLPAGLEAIDASFQTSTPYFKAKGDSWQIGYQTIYPDRVVATGDRLEPGVYSFHYLVRSVTPGVFLWPGATAYLQHTPEEMGRTGAGVLRINAK